MKDSKRQGQSARRRGVSRRDVLRLGSVTAAAPAQFFLRVYVHDRRLDTRQPFHIICVYRSSATNDYLRKHTAGVAKHSIHIEAKAADIRIPGCRRLALQHAATALHDGGVGSYPVSDFVHVDVGRVRRWRFPATARHARPS